MKFVETHDSHQQPIITPHHNPDATTDERMSFGFDQGTEHWTSGRCKVHTGDSGSNATALTSAEHGHAKNLLGDYIHPTDPAKAMQQVVDLFGISRFPGIPRKSLGFLRIRVYFLWFHR